MPLWDGCSIHINKCSYCVCIDGVWAHWTRRVILLVCVKHDVALAYIYIYIYIYDALISVVRI